MLGQSATLARTAAAVLHPSGDGEGRDLPFRIAAFCCGASSVWVLLVQMSGVVTAPHFAAFVYAPATLGMFALPSLAAKRGLTRFVRLFWGSLCAGLLATVVYDASRLPLWANGYPFGAITKMGLLVLGAPTRTPVVEAVGWLYHFTNGCGFAVMFGMAMPRGKWDLALLWALFLEGCMLFTPYAETLHIARGSSFFLVSLYAHVAYGLALGYSFQRFQPRIHGR